MIVLGKPKPCSEGFNTYLLCFQGHRWENIYFSTKPRHVTPQIDSSQKNMNTVLRVSTHIYGVSHEIDGKTFTFSSKSEACDPIKLICLRKISPVLRVSTHIYGVFEEIYGKTFIFQQ